MTRLLFLLAAAVSALFALDRLFLYFERRGWIYWRRTKHRRGGGLGNALLEIQSMLEPDRRHVVEERRRDHAEERESGDPPEAKA